MNEFIRVSPKDARRFWSRVTKSPPCWALGFRQVHRGTLPGVLIRRQEPHGKLCRVLSNLRLVAGVEVVHDVRPHGVLYRAPSLLRPRTAGAAGSGPDAEHRDGPTESDRDGTH
jgi:hypothetical protein